MKIVILATNKCVVSALYGILDVIYAANYCSIERYGDGIKDTIDCQIVTIDNKPVLGYNGIQVMPTQLLHHESVPDIIVVSSSVKPVLDCCADSVNIEQKDEVKPWLQYCHKQGTIITSYCTGSFLLAECGLLAKKIATTHWRSADLFRKLYPFIRLDSDQLIVDNGDVICSGGATAYIDLALYLIEKSIGREVATDCAKLMVFDPVRQRQSPYVSFQSQKKHEDQAILKAQEWLEGHFKQSISIETLAEYVGLGSRTFKRRFKLATNETPINYLQRIRVENVKAKLENSTDPINKIIWSAGYEDISSFRQLFKKFTGITPKDYRLKFG
jgi:transcriptional regulator GlxA family with amidase domain